MKKLLAAQTFGGVYKKLWAGCRRQKVLKKLPVPGAKHRENILGSFHKEMLKCEKIFPGAQRRGKNQGGPLRKTWKTDRRGGGWGPEKPCKKLRIPLKSLYKKLCGDAATGKVYIKKLCGVGHPDPSFFPDLLLYMLSTC